MKNSAKGKAARAMIVLFFALLALFAGVALFVLAGRDFVGGRDERAEKGEDLVVLEVGERVRFSDVCRPFAELEGEENGSKYPIRSQSSDGDVYLDEGGYLSAGTPGYYEFSYRAEKADHSEAVTFRVDVAVYPADESDCIPFDADAAEGKWDPRGCYILAEDVTISDWLQIYMQEDFEGVFINPGGYTITIEGPFSLFGTNKGLLDGLKIRCRYAGTGQPYLFSEVSAFAARNEGVIVGCEADMELDLEWDGNIQPVILGVAGERGWMLENTVRADIRSFNETVPVYPAEDDAAFSRMRGNALYLDLRYAEGESVLPARNVSFSAFSGDEAEAWLAADNRVYNGDGGEVSPVERERVSIVWDGGTVCSYTLPRGGKFEIPPSRSIGFEAEVYAGDAEVLYWTVNGVRFDDAGEVRAEGDIVAEPYAKYVRTTIYSGAWVRNSEEVLVIDRQLVGDRFYVDLFGLFAEGDPLQVMPEEIVVADDAFPEEEEVFNERSRIFLRRFMQSGGRFSIEDGNPEMLFLDNCLYTADGRTLICCFDGEGQTSFEAHPMVRTVRNSAFIPDNEIRVFEFPYAEKFGAFALENCAAAEEFAFGQRIRVEEGNADLYVLLSPLENVRKVRIDEGNPDYFVGNDCVVDRTDGRLVYIPSALGGRIILPDGTVRTDDDPVFGKGVTEIVFPDTFTYFNTVSAFGCEGLKSLAFGSPDSLTVVSNATDVLTELESVTFGNIRSLTCQVSAFSRGALGTVRLPDTLEVINGIFTVCSAFEISEDNAYFDTEDGVLYDEGKKTLIAWPAKSDAKNFRAPDSVTAIAANAFYGSSLETATFAEGLTEIGTAAFEYCRYLTSFRAPWAAVFVADSAFRDCSSLSVFDAAVAGTGPYAFSGAVLEEVTFSDSLTSLGHHAFEGCPFRAVALPSGYTGSVPLGCFYGCEFLSSVDLGGATGVGNAAFGGCGALSSVDLSAVSTIGAQAFTETGLVEAESAALTSVGEMAFVNCFSLRAVDFPNVASVGEDAFLDCSALEQVNIAADARLETRAFYGCSALQSFSGGVSYVGGSAFYGCTSLEEVDLRSEGSVTVEGSAFVNCGALRSVRISAKSVQISPLTFNAFDGLRELCIEGAESIVLGNSAFEGSGLTGISLSAQDVEVWENAFADCKALASVSLSGTEVGIGARAFENCTALEEVRVKAESGSIGAAAFANTPQMSVYLDVSAEYGWEGKVPEHLTVYVPSEVRDALLSSWLVSAERLIAYDFS